MRGKGRANKVPKKKEKKWDTGDLDDRDEELFKHLPNPEDITELSKAKAKRTKKKGKKG